MNDRLRRPLLLLSTLVVLASGAPAYAADDDILFTATLDAAGETWVVDSPATGELELWLERETLRIQWKLTHRNLTTKPIGAALYGPEVVGFNTALQIDMGGDLASPVIGEAILTDGQFQYLIATRMYVNILTERYQRGEIRGQLRRTPVSGERDADGWLK
jgi:hypothetical protein